MLCFTHIPETRTSPLNTTTSPKTKRSTGRQLQPGSQTTCSRCLGSPSPFAASPTMHPCAGSLSPVQEPVAPALISPTFWGRTCHTTLDLCNGAHEDSQ